MGEICAGTSQNHARRSDNLVAMMIKLMIMIMMMMMVVMMMIMMMNMPVMLVAECRKHQIPNP